MTLTTYTKHTLNRGQEIIVAIANWFEINEKQIARLQKVGARFDTELGNWVIEMNKENYLQLCASLKGFQMEYFINK